MHVPAYHRSQNTSLSRIGSGLEKLNRLSSSSIVGLDQTSISDMRCKMNQAQG
jgi:hypothetical protein